MSLELGAGDILAVVGMTREAKILAGIRVVVGGGDSVALADKLQTELSEGGVAALISFGLCGALDPALKIGDLIVADSVSGDNEDFEADGAWAERLRRTLAGALRGRFAGAERPVGTPSERAEIRRRTNASAVDLESVVVAQMARRFARPFAVLRAVSDAADRVLPHAAQVGLGADGRPAVGAVLRSLRAKPWQIPSLVRTALEAEDAFHALERARHLLGPRLGRPDQL